MGLHKWWQLTWMIVSFFLSSCIEGSHAYDHALLDSFFRNRANKEIDRPRTGVFYNLSLPANYTGMEIAVIRLRTDSFWLRGVKHSFLNFPPRVVPQPNRERMAIVYENLGNWSSHYYNVPNHTMVAPVFGFMAFTSSKNALINTEEMHLVIRGDPITIHFPHVGPHEKNNTPICAKFGSGGSVEFNNMTKPNVCEAQSPGHYTLVVKTPARKSPKKVHTQTPKEVHTQSQSKGFTTWWVLGFVIGIVGLIILALVLIVLVKEAKKRRITKMEKNSEGGEPFDTFWIGDTKLPLASMVRTQPVLENDDAIPH